jgi:hypothetical protein
MAGIRKIQGPDGQEHEAEPVGFRTSGEHFNEYLLDDGTVLKVKLVLTEIMKITDMRDQQGNPVYLLQHQQVTSIDSTTEKEI